MATDLPPKQAVEWRGDTLLSGKEYNRLKVQDKLANQAAVLLVDFQKQLRDCEDNRVAIYQLHGQNNLKLQQGLSEQKDNLKNRPIELQPCPEPTKVKTWPIWILTAVGTIGGIVLGSRL